MAVEKKVMVQLETGLHARPAAYFVQEANKYASQVFIEKEGRKVNAKSIMGVMSLAVAKGTEIVISAEGIDEEKAVEALATIVMKTE
ncbi:phosphotransferase system HPr (HPr) family protein [Croceifilum oryzae]|uniref:Phosphocarrier protein HPr n=1 Tax=Croceifilum oryzae TaxID=1553429 RepID=A0AAJ1TBT3_9BACL|nr:HPr family phosphocarrier protein [Croceifilum oryzae]MDQ0415955.1 phosphotransferase system HPr (HPr) family protein [Croceifilum oryzae]